MHFTIYFHYLFAVYKYNNILAKSARTAAQHINCADQLMLSQAACQATVGEQLQPLSA